jgi:hypothetical protein
MNFKNIFYGTLGSLLGYFFLFPYSPWFQGQMSQRLLTPLLFLKPICLVLFGPWDI